jgi:hypothetical protein
VPAEAAPHRHRHRQGPPRTSTLLSRPGEPFVARGGSAPSARPHVVGARAGGASPRPARPPPAPAYRAHGTGRPMVRGELADRCTAGVPPAEADAPGTQVSTRGAHRRSDEPFPTPASRPRRQAAPAASSTRWPGPASQRTHPPFSPVRPVDPAESPVGGRVALHTTSRTAAGHRCAPPRNQALAQVRSTGAAMGTARPGSRVARRSAARCATSATAVDRVHLE